MRKIENFNLKCKNFGIPLFFLRKIEKSLSFKNGKVFLIGGNVRSLILKKKIDSNPDLVTNINYNKVVKCLGCFVNRYFFGFEIIGFVFDSLYT